MRYPSKSSVVVHLQLPVRAPPCQVRDSSRLKWVARDQVHYLAVQYAAVLQVVVTYWCRWPESNKRRLMLAPIPSPGNEQEAMISNGLMLPTCRYW